ncbi:TRAP transporter fused permease subunit [Roseobacter sp. YSTF-M11]|uniref:TRAP transporter fused permease subunit n=2 Tax=Roseobacter insulae TaxID=2859783 RepID=A0A9X1FT03_9RHOB|nr:TRAP transporter fused permease subunit [Roseobacter insulae]
MAIVHMSVAAFGGPAPLVFRSEHLAFAIALAFLPDVRMGRLPDRFLSLSLTVFGLCATAYIVLAADHIFQRIAYIDPLTSVQLVLGSALVLVILEATRRRVGLPLALTAATFIAYALAIGDIEYGALMEQLYLTTDGIFGIPMGVSATYVSLFIIFGVMVERSGAGRLFMDASLALVGHTSGGPAKVACVTSAFFGSVSGSAVANVMTTGAFTIPLMKRTGYRPAFSGAVEAVASTGGQFMPPIMGATAFVMAEFLGVSYLQVAAYAAVPALLYFLALFAALHFEAKRNGLSGLPRADLPQFGKVLRREGHLALPLVLLIFVLGSGYSAGLAALSGILAVVPATWLRAHTRQVFNPLSLIEALAASAKAVVPVALACACAGIVIGVVTLTGLGIEFASLVISAAGSSLMLALILTMLAGIVLGMGMPTTPAYVIQVSLLVPAVVKLGVEPAAAHLFVLYFAVLSNITPPVAMASLAASAISGARLGETSRIALKLAATAYLVPFLFALYPALLLIGEPSEIVLSTATALIGVVALAAGFTGWLINSLRLFERVIMLCASGAFLLPGVATDIIGTVVFSAFCIYQYKIRARDTSALAVPAPEKAN